MFLIILFLVTIFLENINFVTSMFRVFKLIVEIIYNFDNNSYFILYDMICILYVWMIWIFYVSLNGVIQILICLFNKSQIIVYKPNVRKEGTPRLLGKYRFLEKYR